MKAEVRHRELQPDEIVRKRFSSIVAGTNRREVRDVLRHVATVLDRSREELTLCLLDEAALQRVLRECETTIGALKRQLAATKEQLQACGEAAVVLDETRALAERALRATACVLRTRLRGIQMEAAWIAERSGKDFSQITLAVDRSLSTAIAAMQGAPERLSKDA